MERRWGYHGQEAERSPGLLDLAWRSVRPILLLTSPQLRLSRVYQMTIVEMEETGDGAPQGVVLALVGPDSESSSSRDPADLHVLRMYNLSSLTALARSAIAHKGSRPLEMRRPANWGANGQQGSSPSRRHRPTGSIARSIKSLIDSPGHAPEPPASYSGLLTATTATGPSIARTPPRRRSPTRGESTDSGWDVMEENLNPLKWATDYVPLASQGSRLASSSVTSYATWTDPNRASGGQKLAIATKNSILLYESRKGERAYHFVKVSACQRAERMVAEFHLGLLHPSPAPGYLLLSTGGAARFWPPAIHRLAWSQAPTQRQWLQHTPGQTGIATHLWDSPLPLRHLRQEGELDSDRRLGRRRVRLEG